jgi:hypothetical protein
MNERWLLSRRALLGGLGGLGLSTLLPPSRSRAAGAPSRLIIVHVPEGMFQGAPRPVNGAASFGGILSPLDPYRSQVTVLNNLFMASRDSGPGGDGHARGVPHMLTGTELMPDGNGGGPSVDQHIARAIGKDSRFPSLEFATRIYWKGLNARAIWAGPGQVVPAMQDPWSAYARIFADALPTSTTPTAPKIDLRRSALDYAVAELARLRGRLASTDRERLDSYQTSLRDIERRIAMVAPADAATCTPPALGNSLDPQAEPNYPFIGRLQTDLMVAAMQCGLTRVATLQWSASNDQCRYSWLGINTVGHSLAHNTDNCDPTGSKKIMVNHWYAEQFAYLLGKLSAIPEGDGTMLDNTAVLWVSEFGNSNGHTPTNLMWVLMGNAGGYFRKGGSVLDCGGRSTNDVHASLCHAFGLPDQTYGNPKFCDGPLDALRS